MLVLLNVMQLRVLCCAGGRGCGDHGEDEIEVALIIEAVARQIGIVGAAWPRENRLWITRRALSMASAIQTRTNEVTNAFDERLHALDFFFQLFDIFRLSWVG